MKLNSFWCIKSALSFSAIWLICIGLFVGCQDTGHVYRPQGSTRVRIPLLKNGTYQLDVVELTTLTDLITMTGEAAQFFFSPSLRDNHLSGIEPRARTLKTSDGISVATDVESLQLLTLYYHFESLMKMDESLGIKGLNQWPRSVAVRVRVGNGTDATAASTNNARFSGTIDAFLFDSYTKSDLPLTVNAGVIGHEHFHSFFYQQVLKPMGGTFSQAISTSLHGDQESIEEMGYLLNKRQSFETLSERDRYHVALFRAINEGLADVWGFLYSGDTTFVSRSIPSEVARDLTLSTHEIEKADSWNDRWKACPRLDEANCGVYDLGSQYAKIIRAMIDRSLKTQGMGSFSIEGQGLRKTMALSVIQLLPILQKKFQSLKKDEKILPSFLIEQLSDLIPNLGVEGCQFLKDKLALYPNAKVCTKLESPGQDPKVKP